MLAIEAVSRHFGGLEALVDVSLEVAEGAVVGLIGPNGSGKTTLFNVITGLYAPSSGRVQLRTADITGGRPHKIIRLGIARTFQTPRVYQRMTVYENVRAAQYGIGGAAGWRFGRGGSRRKVGELLEQTGLAGRADTLAKNLPLPEQRRLELARALARSPALLLLDEPAGGMTPAETQDMARLIRDVALPGRTCIVIEHKMDMIAALCERICVLNFGAKIAEGPPGEVLRDPAVLEAYLGAGETGSHA